MFAGSESPAVGVLPHPGAGAGGDVVARFGELELERRRREVELALLVGEVDRQGLYQADGMRTARSWCRGVGRWTNAEASHALRVAALLRAHADTLPVEAAMRLPVGHLRELARVAANPRCGERLGEVMPMLLRWADSLDHDGFTTITRRWESLADTDGAHNGHEESHRTRRISIIPGEHGATVTGHLDAMQTAIVAEIFDRFCDVEYMTDWEQTTQLWGDQAAPDKMPRTAPQRRADAFVAMVLQAAAMPPGSKIPQPLVSIVIDYDTFVGAAHRTTHTDTTPAADRTDTADDDAAGDDDLDGVDLDDESTDAGDDGGEMLDDLDDDGDDDIDCDDDCDGDGAHAHAHNAVDEPAPFDVWARCTRPSAPTDPARRRCETTGGIRLHPDDAFAAAVAGSVRRIVTDPAGVILNAGRRSRLFRGVLRDALMVLNARCPCPGCTIRRRREADHLIAWKDNGETSADNAGPPCRWHNNAKNRGFTLHRDTQGAWHYYRPDGTEVTPI